MIDATDLGLEGPPLSEAESWAEHAYLRSVRTCKDLYCEQFTVEEAIFMCMFYLWAEEYGPGWEGAIDEVHADQATEV